MGLILNRTGVVASDVFDRGSGHKVGTISRWVEFNRHCTYCNLFIGYGNHLRRIARTGNGQGIACGRSFRNGHFYHNLAITQLVLVDVAVIVGIGSDFSRQPSEYCGVDSRRSFTCVSGILCCIGNGGVDFKLTVRWCG